MLSLCIFPLLNAMSSDVAYIIKQTQLLFFSLLLLSFYSIHATYFVCWKKSFFFVFLLSLSLSLTHIFLYACLVSATTFYNPMFRCIFCIFNALFIIRRGEEKKTTFLPDRLMEFIFFPFPFSSRHFTFFLCSSSKRCDVYKTLYSFFFLLLCCSLIFLYSLFFLKRHFKVENFFCIFVKSCD